MKTPKKSTLPKPPAGSRNYLERLRDGYLAKAQACEMLLADVNGSQTLHARAAVALPGKLARAVALRTEDSSSNGSSSVDRPRKGVTVDAILGALVAQEPQTTAELTAAIAPLNPSGHLTHALDAGLITKAPFMKGGRRLYRYAITDAGRARASRDSKGDISGSVGEQLAALAARAGRPLTMAELQAEAEAAHVQGATPQAVGAAVRHGHLKLKGKGKQRTYRV